VREDGNEIPLRETLDARLVGVTVMARLDLGKSSCATSRVLSDWSWLERNYWYIKGAKVAPIKSDEVYEIDTYYKCKNSIL